MSGSSGISNFAAKFLITVFATLGIVTGVWAGLNAWRHSKETRGIAADERILSEIAELAPQVKILVEAGDVEERMRLERQTGQWATFFHSTAQVAGLSSNQYRLPAQKTDRGRGYDEHKFEIQINQKTGVTRQKVAHFLHSVESRRTYLKTLNVDLRRHGDTDDWGGQVTVAYREKRQ